MHVHEFASSARRISPTRRARSTPRLSRRLPMRPPPPPTHTSKWPELAKRGRALASEVYAEMVSEVVSVAQRALPVPGPGRPSLGSRLSNVLIALIALVVAGIGRFEKLLHGTGGLPVRQIREASLAELRRGEGALSDKRLLPSAYEVWIGARADGYLRLRYAYDTARLSELLEPALPEAAACCVPMRLDEETSGWVTEHVVSPAPGTQLAVWRSLKRRLYHYDAGVVAFYGFPRNFLLSSAQWADLLQGRAKTSRAVALDIGAGDGSLNAPMRKLFERIVATELTTPLVCRLRAAGLDGVLAEEPRAAWLGRSSFDMVFILNVLDRCKDPFRMLEQVGPQPGHAHEHTREHGHVLAQPRHRPRGRPRAPAPPASRRGRARAFPALSWPSPRP